MYPTHLKNRSRIFSNHFAILGTFYEEIGKYREKILADIFSSTFVQPVNGSKNSILNWVKKLNLFHLALLVYFSSKLPIKF